MKPLQLTLNKKWFDLIKSGEKKEEYREIKGYWARRLLDFNSKLSDLAFEQLINDLKKFRSDDWLLGQMLFFYDADFKDFNTVRFRNGYVKNAPAMELHCQGITIAQGREEWGADPGKYYFVIRLGEEV